MFKAPNICVQIQHVKSANITIKIYLHITTEFISTVIIRHIPVTNELLNICKPFGVKFLKLILIINILNTKISYIGIIRIFCDPNSLYRLFIGTIP